MPILYGIAVGSRDVSLFSVSRLHDQDGSQAYPSEIFFLDSKVYDISA